MISAGYEAGLLKKILNNPIVHQLQSEFNKSITEYIHHCVIRVIYLIAGFKLLIGKVMMTKRLITTNCLMVCLLLSVVSNLMAAGFSDTFREFIVGNKQSNATPKSKALVLLPKISHSKRCMDCHDGSKATAVVLKDADSPMQFMGHGSVNHPVGMDYEYYADTKPVEFVSLESLDDRIILVNGKVTCISCHSLVDPTIENSHEGLLKTSAIRGHGQYSSNCTAQSNELTTGTNITTLCLSCHAM